MAENTRIEWCDHTFNPWRGCVKVSPGCDNCYAETQSKRNPAVLGEWGKRANRVAAADDYWRKPEKWEHEAPAFEAAHGRRQRVFCASLGDVFENRGDLEAPRLRLLDLIRRTPSLDWLLLTKRPKNVMLLLGHAFAASSEIMDDRGDWKSGTTDDEIELFRWLGAWANDDVAPRNVWLGTSVEDQERADQRVPALLKVPAAVRFLSCEPLLGPVDLTRWLWEKAGPEWAGRNPSPDIGWVIAGGESGSGARPMHPDWVRSLRDQCEATLCPFLFKQWGRWVPYEHDAQPPFMRGQDGRLVDGHGLPTMLTDHEDEPHKGWLYAPSLTPELVFRQAGKKAAGRQLDGRLYDGFPLDAASERAATA